MRKLLTHRLPQGPAAQLGAPLASATALVTEHHARNQQRLRACSEAETQLLAFRDAEQTLLDLAAREERLHRDKLRTTHAIHQRLLQKIADHPEHADTLCQEGAALLLQHLDALITRTSEPLRSHETP